MKIKVDEDLPITAVEVLVNAGYDAVSVLDQGMSGWKDDRIWSAIQAEGRFLVTADKGFADVRIYVPGTHKGVLLLRPDEDGIEPIQALIEAVIGSHALQSLADCVSVATPRGLRIRRPGST